MLIEDLIAGTSGINANNVRTISTSCSQFLESAKGLPLIKTLPASYPNFHKVKVRRQRAENQVTDIFERAFGQTFANLRQRAVFAYPSAPSITEGTELFYVFPVNGYKYMLSNEVSNSGETIQHLMQTMMEQMENTELVNEMVTDLVKQTYHSSSLFEGMKNGSEIILYNIPCYYAVRTTSCQDYKSLTTMMR